MESPSTEIIDAYSYHHLLDDIASEYLEPAQDPFLLRLEVELTLPQFRLYASSGRGCANSKIRAGMWMADPELELVEHHVGFLSQLGQLCIQAKIRDCTNQACLDKKEIMNNRAPKCDWISFRDWAIVAMSCQAAMSPQQKLSRAHTHLARAVSGCCQIMKSCSSHEEKEHENLFRPFLDGAKQVTVDLAGVCNVLYWMTAIQTSIGIGPTDFGSWNHESLPPNVTLPAIETAAEKVQSLQFCKNRIWNLVNLSERKESDLPDLIEALDPLPKDFGHHTHTACTPSKCQQAQIDSTTVGQLHKCRNKSCEQRVFKVDLLGTYLELGKGTAWSRAKPHYLCTPSDPYIAISHVWSDGTGVGVNQDKGSINSCLVDYFGDIAETLGCTAIWWDAISIPLDDKARAKALKKLHGNYANAKYTVVHDNYLLGIEWTDDGRPCLALVLSSWFTRGWTALELAMSKEVKVLYRGSEPDTYVIKDLDKDVLAAAPGLVSRAHWFASSLIRQLRKPINNVGDLLAILRPRSTSRVRDRTVIAGLLVGLHDCDYGTEDEGAITKKVLMHVGSIPYACLFHGNSTMCNSGGFSWSAATLDYMPVELSTDIEGGNLANITDMLKIDRQGAVLGFWYCRPVIQKDIADNRLTPHGNDLAAVVKVNTGLRHWENCLLLRGERNQGPALLVAVVGMARHSFIDCRYIGAVRVASKPADYDSADEYVEDMEPLWEWQSIRIGKDIGKPAVNARKIVEFVDETTGSDAEDVEDESESESVPNNNSQLWGDEQSLEGEDSSRREIDPWYSKPGVTWYQRPNITESEQISDSTELNEAQLFASIQKDNEKAARHLIRNGVNLAIGTKHDLLTSLELPDYITFKSIKMLGDLYLENGMLGDARDMYQRAVTGFLDMNGSEDLSTLGAMYALGNVYAKLRYLEKTEEWFLHILRTCDQKPRQSRKATFSKPAERKSTKDRKHEEEVENESRELEELKLNTIASMSLLYADLDKSWEAAQMYKRALSEFKDLPDQVDAFLYYWGGRSGLLYADRSSPNGAAIVIYLKALEKFESTLGGEHALTLVTAINLAITYALQRNTIEAEELFKRAWQGFEKSLGSEHMMTLLSIRHLGLLYTFQHQFSRAEPFYQRALESSRRKLGSEHILTLNIMSDFGAYYLYQRKPRQAEELIQQTLDGFVKQLGQEHKYSLSAYRDLGTVHTQLRMFQNAENMFQYALERLENTLGRGDLAVYDTIYALGVFYQEQSRFEMAESMFLRCFDGYCKSSGLRSMDTLRTARDLGLTYQTLEQFDNAEEKIYIAWKGFANILGDFQVPTLEAAASLASVNVSQGKLAEAEGKLTHAKKKFDVAEVKYQYALNGLDNALGSDHQSTLKVAHELGKFCLEQEKLSQAEELLQRALTGFEKLLQRALARSEETIRLYDKTTLQAVMDLGDTYTKLYRRSDAKKMYQRVISSCSKEHMEGDFSSLTAVLKLGNLYAEEGQLRDAEARINRALEGFLSTLGADHPLSLDALLSIGRVRGLQGMTAEAGESIQHALNGFEKVLGPNNINTLGASADLGYLFYMRDSSKLGKAESLIRRALSGFQKVLGPDCPSALHATYQLGLVYIEQGKQEQGEEMLQCAKSGLEKIFGSDHPLAVRTVMRLLVPPMCPPDRGDVHEPKPQVRKPSNEEDRKKSKPPQTPRAEYKYSTACRACDQEFGSQYALFTHMTDRNHHGDVDYSTHCLVCDIWFPNEPWRLSKHLDEKKHYLDDGVSTKCRKCKREFRDRQGLFKHLLDIGHYVDDYYSAKCRDCDKKFEFQNALFQHLKDTKHYETDRK